MLTFCHVPDILNIKSMTVSQQCTSLEHGWFTDNSAQTVARRQKCADKKRATITCSQMRADKCAQH